MFLRKVTHISLVSEESGIGLGIDVMSYPIRHAFDDNDRPNLYKSAILEDITGIESIKSSPLGGQVAYGGASYSGVSQQDREIVMTVRPNQLSPGEIKNELNALIGLSTKSPLSCKFYIDETYYNEGFHYRGECYITDVSSPILSEEDKIVITLRFSKPYFESSLSDFKHIFTLADSASSDYFSLNYRYGMNSSKTKVPNPISSDIVYQQGLNTMKNFINAPSPFILSLSIKQHLAKYVKYFSLYDASGNEFTIHSIEGKGFTYVPEHHSYLRIMINSLRRTHLVHSNATVNGYPEIDRYDTVYHCYPNWPIVYPGATEFNVRVGLTENVAVNYDKFDVLKVESMTIAPRVFGL